MRGRQQTRRHVLVETLPCVCASASRTPSEARVIIFSRCTRVRTCMLSIYRMLENDYHRARAISCTTPIYRLGFFQHIREPWTRPWRAGLQQNLKNNHQDGFLVNGVPTWKIPLVLAVCKYTSVKLTFVQLVWKNESFQQKLKLNEAPTVSFALSAAPIWLRDVDIQNTLSVSIFCGPMFDFTQTRTICHINLRMAYTEASIITSVGSYAVA